MNLYIVVEGKTEKRLYRKWINFQYPTMGYVDSISEIKKNNYYIISGKGYPQYFLIIKNAIQDVNELGNINKLIISVDSELNTESVKYDEIINYISQFTCIIPIEIIIEHFCIETWLLGNRNLFDIKKTVTDSQLNNFIHTINVGKEDPELLPNYMNLSRVEFAYKYLQKLIANKYPGHSYSKRKPNIVNNINYFNEIKSRLNDTNHINSFNNFLSAIK